MAKLKKATQNSYQSAQIENYCKDYYLSLDPECLHEFFLYFEINVAKEDLADYVIYLMLCNMAKKAVTLMNQFELTVKAN